MQQHRRGHRRATAAALHRAGALEAILSLGDNLAGVPRGAPEAADLVNCALATILALLPADADLAASFRRQYRKVLDLVHTCMVSGDAVQRAVLQVVLNIALDAKYSPDGPLHEVCSGLGRVGSSRQKARVTTLV
jgi:hypothetical protein